MAPESRRALLLHTQGDGENTLGGSVILPGTAIHEANLPAACGHDFELPAMDSRLTRRLPPWFKSIVQEPDHWLVRLRHPPAKARGGVFLEADFDGLTEGGFHRTAVAGFVNYKNWQCLRFHPGSFAKTAQGGNSNYRSAVALCAPRFTWRYAGGLTQLCGTMPCGGTEPCWRCFALSKAALGQSATWY